MNITMQTSEVLSILKQHREMHIHEFSNQMKGWKVAMEKFGAELSKWKESFSNDIFHDNKVVTSKRPIEPQRPISFVEDYDKLIELITYHIGETIELSEYDFQQIVKDDFGWKGTFLNNSTLYSK